MPMHFNSNLIKRFVIPTLIIFIILRVVFVIHAQSAKYREDYWQRYPVLKDVYGQSQYMMKNWKYWIPDETVYSYAAGAYVKGADPIIVEPTQPPLGKYLIGLSIIMTRNENMIGAVFFIFLLAGIYIFAKQITGSVLISLAVVLASSFEHLFVDQLAVTPLLDIFYITFTVYALSAVSHALSTKRPGFLLLGYLLFGFSMMVKVWLIGAVFVVPVSVYVLIRKYQYYPYIAAGAFVILLVTLACYTRMFMAGYSLMQVLKVQKWLYWYQNGKINHLFTIWPLIFFNQWHVWWGNTPVIHDASWVLSWPIVIGSGLIGTAGVLYQAIKKMMPAVQICALSIASYCAFISLGQPSARYLLPLLLLCYIMCGWILQHIMIHSRILKKIL